MIVGVKTEVKWINSIAEITLVGGFFIFLLIFIVPVLLSFLAQAVIPGLSDEDGFTKALMLLLPGWNLALWLFRIRLYIFFIPAWVLVGGLALIRLIKIIA
ncbi:hypothetical protein [Pedobacter metabolipauper]|uniref:Uncharacterized protein n=1 Tax=Pedobacter metabolipauper TaxID=425513 RepID=A0A4V3D0Y7_9SPHI|nr:hypothetical protein [Pedobacter metabolipauper]TDQ08324.1 hypothetical protein ATK78_2833 [Pedobacter metabolipauper]